FQSSSTSNGEMTTMFMKITIGLALALTTTTGALAASKKKPKITQNPYDLSNQIRRDTYTSDFRAPRGSLVNNPNQGKNVNELSDKIRRDTYTSDFRGRKTRTKQSGTQ